MDSPRDNAVDPEQYVRRTSPLFMDPFHVPVTNTYNWEPLACAFLALEMLGIFFATIGTVGLIFLSDDVNDECERIKGYFSGRDVVLLSDPPKPVVPPKQLVIDPLANGQGIDPKAAAAEGHKPDPTKQPKNKDPVPDQPKAEDKPAPDQPKKAVQTTSDKADKAAQGTGLIPSDPPELIVYNNLPRDRLYTLYNEIKGALAKSPEEAKKLDCHQQLLDEMKKAQLEALILHAEFTKNCIVNTGINGTPDLQDGTCISSVFQFNEAVRMAKKEFSGLMELAYSDELEAEVSRLIQIILVGKKAQTSKAVPETCAFTFREAMVAKSNQNSSIISPNSLMSLVKLDQKESVDIRPSLVKVCTLSHPKIDEALNIVKKLDPKHFDQIIASQSGKEFKDAELRPLLLEVLIEVLKTAKQQSSPEMNKSYDDLIAIFSDDKDGTLAIRIRTFELLVLQSSIGTEGLENELKGICNSLKIGSGQLKQTFTELTFSNPDSIFESTQINTYAHSKISFDLASCGQESIAEYYHNDATVATFMSTTLKKDKSISMETPVSHLRVSWKMANTPFLRKLVNVINPEAAKNTPVELIKVVEEKIDGSIEKLNQTTQIFSNPGFVGYVSSLIFTQHKAEVNPQRIRGDLNTACLDLSEYLKLASLANKTPGEIGKKSTAFKASLQNLHAVLKKKAIEIKDDPSQDRKGLAELIDQLGKKIDLIADYKLESLGMVENVSTALLFDSTKPEHFSWKIKRYEKQFADLLKAFKIKFGELPDGPAVSIGVGLFSQTTMDQNAPINYSVSVLYQHLKDIHTEITKLGDDKAHYTQTHLKYLRDKHKSFFKDFDTLYRQAVSSTSTKAKERLESLEDIGYLIHTGVNLNAEMKEIVQMFNDEGAKVLRQDPTNPFDEELRKEGMHDYILRFNTVFKRMANVPRAFTTPIASQVGHSLEGIFSAEAEFEPNITDCNPIHCTHEIKIRKDGKLKSTTASIAMGTPTKEGIDSEGKHFARLGSPFAAYLGCCKRNKLEHYYGNYQNAIPKSWVEGNENPRCMTLMEACPATTLSKCSPFYKQEGIYANQDKATPFKENLHAITMHSDLTYASTTGNCVNEEMYGILEAEGLKLNETAKTIIDEIHNILFDGKETLTSEDRKVFVDLFYVVLNIVTLVHGEFDSQNHSCKDKIDRGAVQEFLQVLLLKLVGSKGINPREPLEAEDLGMLDMILFPRAEVVRKRTVEHKRFETGMKVAQFMLDNVDKLKKLFAVLLPGYEFEVKENEESTN